MSPRPHSRVTEANAPRGVARFVGSLATSPFPDGINQGCRGLRCPLPTLAIPMARLPTIVLVHGALTDACVWAKVAPWLTGHSSAVLAPAMPLRGLEAGTAYLSAFLDTIDGPLMLVGHSYAGTVISHPALSKVDLKALVYVSAFAPDSGESTGELNARWPGSKLGDETVLTRPIPAGPTSTFDRSASPKSTQTTSPQQRPRFWRSPNDQSMWPLSATVSRASRSGGEYRVGC
jgi:pimeloyl-ACP methyl ester carboxylesterase